MQTFSESLLRGKRVLITAGGTGLGKSMGRRFLSWGVNRPRVPTPIGELSY
jgi:hypothetical protein